MLGPLGAQLERYMDLLSVRQKLVASNIANADTPGYRTQDIDFQAEFANALGSPAHAEAVEGLAVRNDGNNVSIDRESRLLAEDALRFQAASSLLHTQIGLVRAAIKEGQGS
jgi:flagellar basal-body rod protein FlgB